MVRRSCTSPAGASTSTWMMPWGPASSANSGWTLAVGVCFQLTSRPVGTSKSAGSNDQGRSERV